MNRIGRRIGPSAVGHRHRLFAGGPMLLLVINGAGCRIGPEYSVALDSPDPATRIQAIRDTADRRDASAVPLLVDRLEDEDEAVRFYAIQALRRITEEDHGYRYYHPAARRGRAVARWRHSLSNSDGATPSDTETEVQSTNSDRQP